MIVETSAAMANAMSVLEQAVQAQNEPRDRPPADAIVAALRQAEKQAKQQHHVIAFEQLLGDWRLYFATGTRKARQGGIVLGKGFYVPRLAHAQISFARAVDESTGRGEIGNQIQVGPLLLRFEGPAKYLGKQNLLAFDFYSLQLCLWGKPIYQGKTGSGKQSADFHQQSIGKLPFFAFFLATPTFIAARGRGGGLAIWVRRPGADA